MRLRTSLRTEIFVAFGVLILLVFALVGYLTFQSGERAVNDLSLRLATELNSLVTQRLEQYVKAPVRLLESHADAMRRGALGAEGADHMALVFWSAMAQHEDVGYLSFGGKDGSFVGVERLPDGNLRYHLKDERTGDARHTFRGLPDGQRAHRIRVQPGYEPRERPWYTAALGRMQTTWTPILASASSPGATYATVVTPVVDAEGLLRGVMGADVGVSLLNRFLADMTARQGSGVVFVVDAEGLLVASSTDAPVGEVAGDGVRRVAAKDAADPVLRAAAAEILNAQRGFAGIAGRATVHFEYDDSSWFAVLSPLRDDHGLDWVVVSLILEDELLAPFEANTRAALLLTGLALLFALLVSFIISRRIAAPIRALASSARRVQEGDLAAPVAHSDIREIDQLSRAMTDMIQGLRDRDFIKDAFGRYVTPELVDRFIDDPESLRLGGQLQRATLLMSDLRGFTSLSERMSAPDMVALLNRYLGAMTEVIQQHHGTIIEFIGDAIFCVFGAPFSAPDDATRAVECAIKMQFALARFNEASVHLNLPPLEMGIAVNTGEVVAGNLGSRRAAKYGVVGDAVNLTARIESLTTGNQVLMSESTRQLVGDRFDLEGPMEVRVKGVSRVLSVFEVTGVRGDPALSLPRHSTGVLAPCQLPVQLYRLEGYLISERSIEVQSVAIGSGGLRVVSDRALRPLTKLMLKIRLPDGRWTSDAYASVLSCERDGDRWRAELSLSAIRPEDRAALRALSVER